MNTKLLKIFDKLGWMHEEVGKVGVWFDKEFNLYEIQNKIQSFKELFEKEVEDYTLHTGNVIWDDESYAYMLNYELVDNKARELQGILDDLKYHYEHNNLVNEYEDKVFRGNALEIITFREISLSFIEMITVLTKENIFMDGFVEAVLEGDHGTVEYIFEEAEQRLK